MLGGSMGGEVSQTTVMRALMNFCTFPSIDNVFLLLSPLDYAGKRGTAISNCLFAGEAAGIETGGEDRTSSVYIGGVFPG